MFNKYKLSDSGLQLFKQANKINTDQNNLNNKKLKNIIYKLFTSKYDTDLENLRVNMLSSTKKIMSMLFKLSDICNISINAINNLIAIILSDGEKKLSINKVKYNIGFFLNLAKIAMENNDHQTAIIIKSAIDDHNISRLKIKFNKKMKSTYDTLNQKYDSKNNMFSNHFIDMVKNSWDPNWFPSTLVIYSYIDINIKNNFFKKITNIPYNINHAKYLVHSIQSNKYQQWRFNQNKLCNIYEKDPLKLKIALKLNKENNVKTINQLLLTLSYNIKN